VDVCFGFGFHVHGDQTLDFFFTELVPVTSITVANSNIVDQDTNFQVLDNLGYLGGKPKSEDGWIIDRTT
jgi:hypothetical protein